MSGIEMLEHQKLILKNSLHDSIMFEKELLKSIKWLSSDELQNLYIWLKEKYWESHRNIIETVLLNSEI